jgi:outer membrane lipoprotein-sorting protein
MRIKEQAAMSRTTVVLGTFLSLAISAAMAAEPPSAAAKLSPEQIVANNMTARGGAQAWRGVQTLMMSGTMDAGGNESPARLAVQGTKMGGVEVPKRPAEQAHLPFRLELKRGRKSRLEIDFGGQTALQVYDGVNGWKLRPFLNRHEVEPFTEEEMKAVASQSDLDGPLADYTSKGTRVEFEGTEKVEGKDAYRLKLTYKSGETQHLWIDAKTFLEAKIEGTPRRLDGKYHPVEVYYRDFRTVSGLTMPYLMETKVSGVRQSEKIAIEKLTVNPPLEDVRFAKPK